MWMMILAKSQCPYNAGLENSKVAVLVPMCKEVEDEEEFLMSVRQGSKNVTFLSVPDTE